MNPRGAFVFPIQDLDVAGRSAECVISTPWLRGALEGCEMQPAGPDGSLSVHLTKTGNEVLVQGQVDVRLTIPCARCLRPVELRPNIELALLLFPTTTASPSRPPGSSSARVERSAQGKKKEDDRDFADDEAGVDTYEGDEVVLDRFVREAILLESPTFPLCSEACEGIRPASDSTPPTREGVTDPRLLPLLELAKRRNWKE